MFWICLNDGLKEFIIKNGINKYSNHLIINLMPKISIPLSKVLMNKEIKKTIEKKIVKKDASIFTLAKIFLKTVYKNKKGINNLSIVIFRPNALKKINSRRNIRAKI